MTDIEATGSSLLIQIESPAPELIDVGFLKNHQSRNWFEFLPSYWNQRSRPILGQVFEEHGREWKPNSHVALPRWFSHLLPEGRLREAVSLAADVKSVREFELLRRLGLHDLPGAVRAVPIEVDGLDYRIPGPEERDELVENPLLKFSLAGAQLKYSIFADGRGLTVPARGVAGNVIAKLPDGRAGFSGVPEAEFGSLELARQSGIESASTQLVKVADIEGLAKWADWVGDLPVLAVSRFDRLENGNRVHMEELAQVLDIPTAKEGAKYGLANFEMIARYIAGLSGVESVSAVIDRLVLNVLIGNGDAHLKNWSFLYPDGQNPELSPAYDVLPTVLYVARDDLGLKLNGSRDFEDVTIASFDRIGSETGFGVSAARQQAVSAVERIRENWSILKDCLTVPNFDFLTERLRTLPLSAP